MLIFRITACTKSTPLKRTDIKKNIQNEEVSVDYCYEKASSPPSLPTGDDARILCHEELKVYFRLKKALKTFVFWVFPGLSSWCAKELTDIFQFHDLEDSF